MNDDHDKEMLDENTNNFQGQKSLTYEFSTLDKVATEEEDVKSTLGSLKLRNMNSFHFRSNRKFIKNEKSNLSNKSL